MQSLPGSFVFTRLIVPLDGSRLAEASLAPAIAIAEKCDAEIVLLHVLEDAVLGPEKAEAYLSRLQRSVQRAQVRCRVRIIPAEVDHSQIVRAAMEENASLIVMSTHGRSGRRTLEEGSVALQVLHETHIPVLFAKPTQYRHP